MFWARIVSGSARMAATAAIAAPAPRIRLVSDMSPPSLQALQRGVRSDGWLEDDASSLSLWRFAARPQPTPDCIGAVRPVRIASALEEAMVWSRRRMIRSGLLIAL